MSTVTGKMLRINLSDKSSERVQIKEEWKDLYVGGEGYAAKILYDNLQPGMDPMDERNLLVFTTGPLTGTRAPSSGRLVIGYKSPLTGTIGRSSSHQELAADHL